MTDVSELDRQVSQEIAARRRQIGKRQIDMWIALGMSKSQYRALEQSSRYWTFRSLAAVAAELGVRVSDLVRAAEERIDAEPGGTPRED